MDKETFSSYGWIVITVLVLAVMLTLATPFGEQIRDNVVDAVNGFDGKADTAISNMGSGYSWAE